MRTIIAICVWGMIFVVLLFSGGCGQVELEDEVGLATEYEAVVEASASSGFALHLSLSHDTNEFQFVVGQIEMVNPTHVNMFIEVHKGIFDCSDALSCRFTTLQSSCPGKDPFEGKGDMNNFSIKSPSGTVINLVVDSTPADKTITSIIVTGCFEEDGFQRAQVSLL